jgi:hypothetical protein
MINSHCCRWIVCRVNCQLYEQRDLKHNSGISYVSAEEIKKKHASSSGSAVQDTYNNSNDIYTPVTSAILQLCSHTGPYNRYCIFKQHTAACPLLPVAAI